METTWTGSPCRCWIHASRHPNYNTHCLGNEEREAELMSKKDDRSKLMNQILSGIKVIQLYGWENALKEQVNTVRKEEKSNLRKLAVFYSSISFLQDTMPILVAVVSLTAYSLIDTSSTLTASKCLYHWHCSIWFVHLWACCLSFNPWPCMQCQVVESMIFWTQMSVIQVWYRREKILSMLFRSRMVRSNGQKMNPLLWFSKT